MRPSAQSRLPIGLALAAALSAAGCEESARVPDAVAAAPTPVSAKPAPVSRPVFSAPEKGKAAPASAEPAPDGSIVLNQHGFLSIGPKIALRIGPGAASPFEVLNDRGQVVFTGVSAPVAGLDPQSGTAVQRLDFGGLTVVGEGFTVRMDTSVSDPFLIGQPYETLARDSLNYFYQSRFAEAVEASFVPAATPSLTRAQGHADSRYGCFSGTDLRGTDWPGCDYQLTVRGGWYDAGDYGQYALNTAFASWTLMNMAEREAKPISGLCRPALADNTLRLPEAGNRLPDVLDEAKRGIDNLLSTQVVSTTPQALARGAQRDNGPLMLTPTDASGMVHHKVHGVEWHGADAVPAGDTIPRRLYPPTTAATLSLAAVGAQCARVFRGHDRDYAATCLEAAETAFAAALRVPDAYAWGEFTGGGPYDDRTLDDEFGWAATELWLATGKAEYLAEVERRAPGYNIYSTYDWRTVEARGMVSLAVQDGFEHPRARLAREAARDWGDRLAAEAGRTHYGMPYEDTRFYWGSNGQMMNRALILGTAYELSWDTAHRDAVIGAMDYLLGRNALSQSFVTGYGERPMREPHHRFWRGALDSTRPFPPPGVLSGGPNNVNFIDPVGSTLRGRCTGMACWADEWESYSMNEVALNWNASLAWTAHWLHRQSKTCNNAPRDTAEHAR